MPLKRKRTPSAKAAALSKKSKTSETSSSTEQPEASKTSSSSASSMSQTTKQQLIDELVPAVTKGVVESLVAMKVLPGTSTTEEQTSTQDEHTTSDVQTQGNISTVSTFPQELLTISMHVEQKTRSKIWADEYIDLGLLLPASAMDSADDSCQLRMVESTSGLMLIRKPQQKTILSLPRWFSAFHCFVSIYTEKFPHAAPALMQYTETIRKLGQRAGDEAALFYDKTFRQLRQTDPTLVFSSLHTDTYTEALAMGLTQQKKSFNLKPFQAFRSQGSPQAGMPCYSFNNNNGKCTRPRCPFKHVCQRCYGPHSKKSCGIRPAVQPSTFVNKKPANQLSNFKR
ncbi:uncharacterized protein LOC132735666 [Ruditapes philippinarum]|uniref:uncharacterized protein LOC132735666 n=1 Tax=Ruditapes philippinarum TaxID=129788 RepID=UPI00295AFC6A|nr:uncharacterized protein LOC132735666 [Ruditapes philippinarum]XP_060578627.1 uncharacterized protein LOC132735666 [Ruditapes philippinarum]